MTDKPAMRSAQEESHASFNLRMMQIRLQHRIDARLEEHNGDEQAAITSSGIGIGFLFATQISRSIEEGLREIDRLQNVIASQRAEPPDGWQLVPKEPIETMWSNLARDIIVFLTMEGPHHATRLYRHLNGCGTKIPDWIIDECGTRHHTPAMGTFAACIYKAMLSVAPPPE